MPRLAHETEAINAEELADALPNDVRRKLPADTIALACLALVRRLRVLAKLETGPQVPKPKAGR